MAAGVVTFELAGGDAAPVREDPTLAAASSALPQGAYTTVRTYGGRAIVRLQAHLHRLEESLQLQGRPATLDSSAARRAVAAVLRATGHPESRLRLTFSPPAFYVSVEPFIPLPAELYRQGAACVTLPMHRENPHAKDTRFIAAAQRAYARLPPGVEEGLLLGDDGAILEGLSSNFFAVVDGTLHTEDERALSGVTRALVLEVATARMPVAMQAVLTRELGALAEAFVTSVSREVLPVAKIDGRRVGDGRVGPHTRAIVAGFADLVRREAEPLD